MDKDKITSSSESNNEEKPLNILLVGTTGSGKSSTGNVILSAADGEKVLEFFETKMSAEAVTQDCTKYTRCINGRKLTIVDTPGVNNFTDNAEKVQAEVEAAVRNSSGYHAIIYVVAIFKGELSLNEEEVKTFDHVQKLLGENMIKHTVLVFTHGNNYKRMLERIQEADQSKEYPDLTFDEYIMKDEYSTNKYAIGPTARIVDARAVLFENKEKCPSKRADMVNKLLEKIDEVLRVTEGCVYDKELLPPKPYREMPELGSTKENDVQQQRQQQDDNILLFAIYIYIIGIIVYLGFQPLHYFMKG